MQMNIVMVWVHANSLPTDLMWCAPILVTHVYLSWSVPYSFVTGPEIQIPHQPGSPEYTLHRSISEKFTIRRFLVIEIVIYLEYLSQLFFPFMGTLHFLIMCSISFQLALMQIQATWSLNLLLLWNQSPIMM